MWGIGPFFAQLGGGAEGGWLNLLLGSGGLLAGLVVAVRAYDSGRVITRHQHEATVKHLKEVHAAHVADLKARAQEDREQRARYESLWLEALRATRNGGKHAPDHGRADDEGLARVG